MLAKSRQAVPKHGLARNLVGSQIGTQHADREQCLFVRAGMRVNEQTIQVKFTYNVAKSAVEPAGVVPSRKMRPICPARILAGMRKTCPLTSVPSRPVTSCAASLTPHFRHS